MFLGETRFLHSSTVVVAAAVRPFLKKARVDGLMQMNKQNGSGSSGG